MELLCSVQNYAWGKIGDESMVAKLSNAEDIDPSKPYAELWMGTHPSGPSRIKETGQLLQDYIKNHPECLGDSVRNQFGDSLPFLFKVLSVNKSLSIQAHPNKSHAEELHTARPEVYKDPNHKPEMAIALTEFHALCGFRPLREIQNFMKNIPELRECVGEASAQELCNVLEDDHKDALRRCFTQLMKCPEETLQTCLQRWLTKVQDLAESERVFVNGELFLQLHSQFPGDVGCFGVYFFNHVILHPGQAMFLGPNEPHAYLKGDCIECMACSDNVVRAGLTPKLKDVDTLCTMLTYRCAGGEHQLFHGERAKENYITTFSPPVPDFAVRKIELSNGLTSLNLPSLSKASILLIVRGSKSYKDGTVLFIPANTKPPAIEVQPQALLFRAMANV